MVAYGVPVIHQSLATAPLDIKEAIDWLIRIGGKDVKEKGKDRTNELINVVREIIQKEYGYTELNCIVEDIKQSHVSDIMEHLTNFIGYHDNTGSGDGIRNINGSGIGRRSGMTIVDDLVKYLQCCKEIDGACDKANCKCCEGSKLYPGNSNSCGPTVCPIKPLLKCPMPLTVSCEGGTKVGKGHLYVSNLCCILSFIVTCFSEKAELDNSSLKCKHCDNGNQYSVIHKDCHRMCKCKHRSVLSKVSCRMNCLIQLAVTFNTVYTHKDAAICEVCVKCATCGRKCKPCLECVNASRGKGHHCSRCKTGECCDARRKADSHCESTCRTCPTCCMVRSTSNFWSNIDVLLNCCALCTACRVGGVPNHKRNCKICKQCKGQSCINGCKNRKDFGRLIVELFHFMVYNFRDAIYVSKKGVKTIKQECCHSKTDSKSCACRDTCCRECKENGEECAQCSLHCVCCVDKDKSCACSSNCSEKLELVLRPTLSGYFSAYDYRSATWDNLCKVNTGTGCSQGCTQDCQCRKSVCPSNGCCTHCPKRQCAKIFCFIMPTLQNFTRYMLDILTEKSVERETYDAIHYPTTKRSALLITGDTHLARLLRSCGFHTRRLGSKRGCEFIKNDRNHVLCRIKEHKPGNIKEMLDSCKTVSRLLILVFRAFVTSTVATSVIIPCHKPRTVYEKLLWLSGLPYCKAYGITRRSFKHVTSVGNAGNNFLGLSLRMALYVFHVMEDSCDSVWEYITQGFKVPGGSHYLYYNPDPLQLLWDIYDVVYSVTCAMAFIIKQCSVNSINSGWEDCLLGRNLNVKEGWKDACKCQSADCDPACAHCTRPCNACRGDAKCVCCCPHCAHSPADCICLMKFIVSDGRDASDSGQSISTPFCNNSYGYIGLPKEHLRVEVVTGGGLADRISGLFCRDYAIFSRLLEYLLRSSAGVPDNVSDYYSLFLHLGMRLDLEKRYNSISSKPFTSSFRGETVKAYIGAYDGIVDPVVRALHRLYNQDCEPSKGMSSGHINDSHHDASDMMSLSGCSNAAGCAGYLYPLPSVAYELLIDNPYRHNEETASIYVSWIFAKAGALYITMRSFADSIKTLDCCSTSTTCTCHSTIGNKCMCDGSKGICYCLCGQINIGNLKCSCATAVKCRNLLPFLYRHGFTFSVPHTVSSSRKKCKDFSDTLDRFVAKNSMLCKVLHSIEAFLWAVRRPFCIAMLVIWVALFCFLSYVLMYRLDKFHVQPYVFIQRQVHSRTNMSGMDVLYI